MKSADVRERFVELRARGHSYAKISDQIGVSKPTLIKWNRQYDAQIRELADEELEAVVERFRIARVHRVERFVKLIDLVEKQLDTRDLGEVQTAPLIREWIRLMQAVRMELEPQRFQVDAQVSTEFQDGMMRYVEILERMFEPGSPQLEDALRVAAKIAPEVVKAIPKLTGS